MSQELLESVFIPAFRNPVLERRSDSAVLAVPSNRLAFSTDAYVVRPLFFPGGNIGELAVHGTVNDLAMSGAQPLALSASFILEEGLPMEHLRAIVVAMGQAASSIGVPIVTGDTKVVERGKGDGCYITTSGIGVLQDGVDLGMHRIVAGDVVLISGTIGDHGMAILGERDGLAFASTIQSDTAPLHGLVAPLLAQTKGIRAFRDPTRGGLSGVLNEIAEAAQLGIEIDEAAVPMDEAVQAACEILGLDPLLVANEGKMVVIVSREEAEAALAILKAHPLGRRASRLGTVVEGHAGKVVARTSLGTSRWITMPIGDQLPRIC